MTYSKLDDIIDAIATKVVEELSKSAMTGNGESPPGIAGPGDQAGTKPPAAEETTQPPAAEEKPVDPPKKRGRKKKTETPVAPKREELHDKCTKLVVDEKLTVPEVRDILNVFGVDMLASLPEDKFLEFDKLIDEKVAANEKPSGDMPF